jgi:hypothetical protein
MKKALPLMLALIITAGFFLIAFSTSSGFNFIPYLIHESISPGGANETTFIIVFDIVIGLLLFFLAYKIFTKVFKPTKTTKPL